MTKRNPPNHLREAGRDFWKRLHDEYEFQDSAELALVTAAAECLDRMAAAREAIATDGELTRDRYGQLKVSPAVELERRAKGQFATIVKQLGLDESEHLDRRYQHVKQRARRHGKKA